MKQIVFLAIMVAAFPAWAQAPKEPLKPPVQEAAKPAPVKEPAKPVASKEAAKTAAEPAKQATVAKKPRRWHEDARHCLERVSNTEIIKCAEEFL